MKNFKKQRGITLVALIITIVVLLILAVVAIGTLRDSDIIGYAQNTAGSYNQSKENEVEVLATAQSTIEKYIPKSNKIKSGYYVIKDVYNEVELAEIWHIELKEPNKIYIKYYYVEDNVLIREIDFGEGEIVEENTKSVTVINGYDWLPVTIQPNYFYVVGRGVYIKDDKAFFAENPEDENTNYIVSTLDEDFVLPE